MQAQTADPAFAPRIFPKIVKNVHILRIINLTYKDNKNKIIQRKALITIQKAY